MCVLVDMVEVLLVSIEGVSGGIFGHGRLILLRFASGELA